MRQFAAAVIHSGVGGDRGGMCPWRLVADESALVLFQHHGAPPTEEANAMTGIELLLMPLFTMGSAIYLAVSQIRSTRDE